VADEHTLSDVDRAWLLADAISQNISISDEVAESVSAMIVSVVDRIGLDADDVEQISAHEQKQLWSLMVRFSHTPAHLTSIEHLLSSVFRARGGVASERLRTKLATSNVALSKELANAFAVDGLFRAHSRVSAAEVTLHLGVANTDELLRQDPSTSK